MIRITPTISIDERSITESFVRASGPGGQNVNKVATAVQLRFDPAASGLPDNVRARLHSVAGRRMTQQGVVLITSQRHRTQERNRQAALDALIRLLQRAAAPVRPRIATRPGAAAKQRRLDEKARRARTKRVRSAPVEE